MIATLHLILNASAFLCAFTAKWEEVAFRVICSFVNLFKLVSFVNNE